LEYGSGLENESGGMRAVEGKLELWKMRAVGKPERWENQSGGKTRAVGK
jgi:hypothetical protein